MSNLFWEKTLFTDKNSDSCNFFDFIESDISKVFDEKGEFVILNILNLKEANNKYGIEVEDVSSSCLNKSLMNAISKFEGVHFYNFGLNDFLIIFPSRLKLNPKETVANIEKDFRDSMIQLNYPYISINSLIIEYGQEIASHEDFYYLLMNKLIEEAKSNSEICNSKRLLKNIIDTFVRNIKYTITEYENACGLALSDDISGLQNQRSARLHINNLIEKYKSNSMGFSVLFIDGDSLRRYNKVSYEAGNDIIKTIAQIIQGSIRGEDRVYRWLSGDEFLIVLAETDGSNAIRIADRVRKDVEAKTQDCIFPTTISVGIACYPTDGKTIEEVMRKAEKANDYAKKIGRNKVIMWDNELDNYLK